MNRETWLLAAKKAVEPLFKQHGYTVPEKIRVSCGWPSVKALGKNSRRIGECWATQCSRDESWEIFISPALADPVRVLDVLVHEIVHAVVGLECGHTGAFRKCALAVGLTGKMTATEAGPELKGHLAAIANRIGTYPHAALDSRKSSVKKQSTRLLKVSCESCGYTVRTTQKWIDVGLPTCPCGCEMTHEDGDEDGDD